MSSKRKCIVILLFIVLVTILFILYNRSQFFLGISYRCKYSVYEVHSKSFKNHSNLTVNNNHSHTSIFQTITPRRILPPRRRHRIKFKKNLTTTTDLPILIENSLKTQKLFLTFTGLKNSNNNVTKYRDCPEGRVLTVLFTGRLGNVIWEYMSLIAVEELYNDRLNIQAYTPSNMKRILGLLFEEINTPELIKLPMSCVSMRNAQLIKRNGLPQYDPRVPYNSPLLLDAFSCRYKDIVRYGLDRIKERLRFRKDYLRRIADVLRIIKYKFHFNDTENVTYVGVHYRGEDYNVMLNKTYPELFKESIYNFRGPPTFLYYKNAMEYFNNTITNVIFILITTDKEWMKTNVPLIHGFKNFIVNPIGGNASMYMVEDFMLLSSCNHSVINYGTYATASALFAGGTTIVYDMNIPEDGRGYSLAISLVSLLPHWFVCNEIKCSI